MAEYHEFQETNRLSSITYTSSLYQFYTPRMAKVLLSNLSTKELKY